MKFEILHRQAITAASNLRIAESRLIDLFQQIEACSGFLQLGYTSLHVYATEALGLSDDCAYKLIRVQRKAVEVPDLKEAVASGKITVSKAVVIVPVINPRNKNYWIEMAANSSKRELEKAVAEVNPELAKSEKAKPIGNNLIKLELTLTEDAFALLKRAQELFEQKKSTALTFAETIHLLSEQFVKREDPVEKADRNAHKTGPGASKIHKVHRRDRGRCQFVHANGKPCQQRKWLHVHHIKPKEEGGGDEPENLITLCSAHHKIVHTYGMPLH